MHQYLRVGKIHGEVFAGAKARVGPARKNPDFDERDGGGPCTDQAQNEPVEGVSRGAAATSRQDKRSPASARGQDLARRAVFWQPESAATLVLADAGPDRPYSGCGGSA